MKFDVIIGNPPYQIDSKGNSKNAKPIYHKFIQEAIMLEPKYISFIVPSRWFSGGMGLGKFRKQMLSDKRLKTIVDFEDAKECFPSVKIEGGVNYFLWDKDYQGSCFYQNKNKKFEIVLSDFNFLIRDMIGLKIIDKIKAKENTFLVSKVSAVGPFGQLLKTNFEDYKIKPDSQYSVKLYGNKQNMKETNGIGYIKKEVITQNQDLINKYKVMTPKARKPEKCSPDKILGSIMITEPNSVCSFTYIIVSSFDKKEEAENMDKYIKTKFFRYLVSLIKNTQDVSRKVFQFVPDLPMTKEWTDEKLYKRYNLTKEEIAHIENKIAPME